MTPEQHDPDSRGQPQPEEYSNEADGVDISGDAVQNIRRVSAGGVGMGVETQTDIMSILSGLNQQKMQNDRTGALVKMREDAVWQKHEKPAVIARATTFLGGVAVGVLVTVVVSGISSRK